MKMCYNKEDLRFLYLKRRQDMDFHRAQNQNNLSVLIFSLLSFMICLEIGFVIGSLASIFIFIIGLYSYFPTNKALKKANKEFDDVYEKLYEDVL